MIYTVTFNPSLDYIVSVDDFTCGIVNRTTDEIIFPGGKGINVSIVLKNLGFENTALGFLAGFTGNRIQELLEEKGVRTDFISVENGISRINVKLRSNEETEINGQGPAIAEMDIEKLYEKLDTLSDGDILVLAGSIPDVMPGSMYMDIMKHLQNKDLKIVVDATKDLLVNVLQYHPFLIKPNNHELGEIFGVKIENKADVITYAKKMQEKGARNVLVSMAGDGAVLDVYKRQELDGKVVPLEIKSGKDYKRHSALNNVLKNENYKIEEAYILSEGNIEIEGKRVYMPIYMIMFLENTELTNTIYKIDLDGLGE